jgi:serine phosphatase RsbU (regulator of sigma subunit)
MILLIIISLSIIHFLGIFLYFRNKKQKFDERQQQSTSELFFHEQYNQILSDMAELIDEKVQQERFEIQRKNAAVIQTSLNTHFTTQCAGLQVAGKIVSADECSGDWWYSYTRGDKLFVWIGDVTGHGVAAAIVASACRAVVTSFEHGPELGLPAGHVDDEVDAVKESLGSQTVITGFYSHGEICPLHQGKPSELHNQTMTITYLSEGS